MSLKGITGNDDDEARADKPMSGVSKMAEESFAWHAAFTTAPIFSFILPC